ncbi:MAG: hypothetical protein EXX96DRAFT_575770 [Benjaminiella poitrasii]|nr:MAG: hypothetical protein EXX96DRAFT_575770 [Benjaminiella poitrasii]
MNICKMVARSLESLPSIPTKFTKSLPCDIYTASVTEAEQTSLMRTPRPVHNAVYSHVYPESAPDPTLLAISKTACQSLDLDPNEITKDDQPFVSVFSGNRTLPDTRPWSLCYAGHQFGYFAGQLGDGRAVSLFETVNSRGEKWELQLKGAGRTPYSRFGDGYAVLRSSIREFLISEYMNALDVPTTRALCLIGTSREVYREDGPTPGQPERGAIVTRMAPSWLRFGNFEIFYSRDDFDNVRRLTDYVIDHVVKDEPNGNGNKYARFFRTVTRKTARMVADWQAIGFNHGVLNTDNMSLLGLTMDYGPFQIMDYYDPSYVCNHSDSTGRYSFHRQPSVCIFNLIKLSVPLFELIGAGEKAESIVFPDLENETKEGVTDEKTRETYRNEGRNFVEDLLNVEFKQSFMEHLQRKMNSKIGLVEHNDGDVDDVIIPLLDWLTAYHVEYHRFYRSLSNYKITAEGEDADAQKAINEWLEIVTEDESQVEASKEALKPWLALYRHRLLKENRPDTERKKQMDSVNPRFVLRNSIAEEVIEAFEKNDEQEAKRILNVCLEACVDPFKSKYDDELVESWINKAVPKKDMRCSCSS